MSKIVSIPVEEKCLIVQPDLKVLLEVNSIAFEKVRCLISPFLELVKSPKLFYTYQLTDISLWNGLSAGLDAQEILDTLDAYSKFPLPSVLKDFILDNSYNYGIIKMREKDDNLLEIFSEDTDLVHSFAKHKRILEYLIEETPQGFIINRSFQGIIKSIFINLNFPLEDLVKFKEGDSLEIDFNQNNTFEYRDYQKESVNIFLGEDKQRGAGVVVLPCGSGKTAVGVLALLELKMKTLIITPNIISLKQWKIEILRITNIAEEMIGEYSGERKEIRPITLSTYQILIHRKKKGHEFTHFDLFLQSNWGLIIYDEIHMLPAPVFRGITGIQSKRRLGLTATLIREDGKEKDVFALVGPKKYDLPWKELEKLAFIATAYCVEIKVKMLIKEDTEAKDNSEKAKFRIASENPYKSVILKKIVDLLPNESIIIIGKYLKQLENTAKELNAPLITGKTNNQRRQELYEEFKRKKIKVLVVSKVANFAVDIPNASVAIQISGTFGSRQEEAQRLGRILRPKKENNNRSIFINIITKDSQEEVFSYNRKRFLMEQGYQYRNLKESELQEISNILLN